MKVLLADDEPSMQSLIRQILERGGYSLISAMDGNEAIELALAEEPDLIILDVMMPGLDGFETCRILRHQGVSVPILILSAKGELADKGIGFSVGADDYLVKPFKTEELLMRVQAHLRRELRSSMKLSTVVEFADGKVDTARHKLTLRGKEVDLTHKESHILAFLVRHKGEIVTREQLIAEVWGEEFLGETSSVAVFIRKLREKIEEDPSHPKLIKTLRNQGYIFVD